MQENVEFQKVGYMKLAESNKEEEKRTNRKRHKT